MEKGKIAEVVIYKVNADKVSDKQLLLEEVNKVVGNFDGFVSRSVHQSPEDSTLFMDYVIWDSLEQAVQAAQKAEQMVELRPFMSVVEEIRSFHHFEMK